MNPDHNTAKEHARVAIRHLARFCRGKDRYTAFNPSVLDLCIKHLVDARCHMAVGDVFDIHERPRTATEVMQAMQLVNKLYTPQ